MVRTAELGIARDDGKPIQVIGFDMGGTSTDVSHYAGEFERAFETQVAGVRVRAPMMAIHTVAAGGGSILAFDGARFRVGPESAGANPGPACYRRGGPLTVTDANLALGKIQPAFFPRVFGPRGDEALDGDVVAARFAALAGEIAAATGKDDRAGGGRRGLRRHRRRQHGQRDQEDLGRARLRRHPLHAAVLRRRRRPARLPGRRRAGDGARLHPSARRRAVGLRHGPGRPDRDAPGRARAAARRRARRRRRRAWRRSPPRPSPSSAQQGVARERIVVHRRVHLRYEGTDSALVVPFADEAGLQAAFEAAYRQRFAFLMSERRLIVEAVSVEAVGAGEAAEEIRHELVERRAGAGRGDGAHVQRRPLARRGAGRARAGAPGQTIAGPAIVVESNATTIVEPGWTGRVTALDHLVLERTTPRAVRRAAGTSVDPVLLEVFNNLFMNIAEQMGLQLQNTAYSVNIKERLDFSCALFDADGNLIANAPHMPVHLGSMSESIKTVIARNAGTMQRGDVYALNDPYHGGTHLPDVTVVTPVYLEDASAMPTFYVGSRGHHADIGGTTPGSMPPFSTRIEEEGVQFDNVKLVEAGRFLEAEMRALLESGPWPSRNPAQNIADLKAQVAANEKGVRELAAMVGQYGLDVVQGYMRHVQDNAEESVRRVITRLKDGGFTLPLDNGAQISVAIRVDAAARSAEIDFTGTSAQLANNFNAPTAVCMAAVLYVFRTLVDDEIPLNAGCLKPIKVIIPEGSMLNPRPPASVVAGNVETSTCITNTLYGALGVMAAAQCTMNNFTFGNARHQYYETISGGSGAGSSSTARAGVGGFDGTSVVQTHMTNSRLTDPEVLEFRFPVRLDSYEIRAGSGGAGALARRRRRHAPGPLPRADDRVDPVERPPCRRLRHGRRRRRPAGDQPGRARRRQRRGARPHRQRRDGGGRRVRDRDARRRRLRAA